MDCRDHAQIINRQSWDHIKSCQPESINYPSKNNTGSENNYTNDNKNKEKERQNKTKLKKSSQKNKKEKCVLILGSSVLKTWMSMNLR